MNGDFPSDVDHLLRGKVSNRYIESGTIARVSKEMVAQDEGVEVVTMEVRDRMNTRRRKR